MGSKMSLSIFLYGTWKQNLGDDLFLKVMVDRYPNYTFHILANNEYVSTYSKMSNVIVHKKRNFFARVLNYIYRKLNRPNYIFIKMASLSDAVVFLGGSLYQQEEHWLTTYNQRFNLVSLFDASFAIGNNFGPYADSEFYDKYKNLFCNMTDVCFRDQYSMRLFPYKNVRMAADVIFCLEKNVGTSVTKAPDYDSRERYAVISVIDLNYNSISRKFEMVTSEKYEKWIGSLILELERQDYQVILMGFCDAEGDGAAMDRIYGLYQFQQTRKYMHKDIEESLNIIKSAELVISTRFHAMILGWIYNKKVVPIVYGSKMQNVIEDSGFKGCCVDIEQVEDYAPSYVISNAKNLENVKQLSQKAKEQFWGFDKWSESL